MDTHGRQSTNRWETSTTGRQQLKQVSRARHAIPQEVEHTTRYLLAIFDAAAGEIDIVFQDSLPRTLGHELLPRHRNAL